MLIVSADWKSINKLHLWFLPVCDSVKFLFAVVSKRLVLGIPATFRQSRKGQPERKQKQKQRRGLAIIFQGRIIPRTRACLLSGWLLRLPLAAYLVVFPYVLNL